MNVDYKAIAERVWQQWPSASHVDTDVVIDIYNELKSEMQSDGLLPERRTTEQELYKILGLQAAGEFMDSVELAITSGDIRPVILDWLKGNIDAGDGLDVCNPEVRIALSTMASAEMLSPASVDVVLALGEKSAPKWPGLKPGHVQDAMRMHPNG